MDLPQSLIAQSLQGFCICYFKNVQHEPNAPPHFHVTVPVNDDSSLLLCIITSQTEKKAWYYRKTREDAIESLVAINKESFPFLVKESLVDCNQPILVRKSKINDLIDPKCKFEVKVRDIPQEIKERIVTAIQKSPLVKPVIKKMLVRPVT